MAGSQTPNLDTRIGVAQVEALFGVVTLGVGAAAFAAAVLGIILYRSGLADARSIFVWVAYIAICAAAHIALRHFYWRSRPVGEHWQMWAILFTAISLAEGIGWGWSPIGLANDSRFEVELIVMLVTLGVAAGSVPCFGAYLPAVCAIFLPATVPYAVTSATSADPLRRSTFILILIFIVTLIGLAIVANRSFRQLVGLRLRTEELAADLQRQRDIAEQANLAKSTFLAAASHDLRQPIHALGLFVGALRGVAMAPEGIRMLEQLEVSIDAMDSLFTALLDISRLDAGTVEVHARAFAIGPLAERICADYAADAARKHISLVCKRTSAIVESDPVLIERVLRNLISNAVRYTERGRIVVGCRRSDAQLSIQVWDTGVGIPSNQRIQVFREYYQLGNTERDRSKGLGLGLAIVKRLTELLDCPLTLRSRVGHGSCFAVTVPLSRTRIETDEMASDEQTSALSPGCIVVIDDELAIRQAMSSLLTSWGHDIVVASSGEEAMRRLSTHPVRPDLIICDYRLRDGETGVGVVERLRLEYNEDIPAMLITGDTAPDRLAEAQRSGLLLLHKPVSNSKLRAAIANLMFKKHEAESEALTSAVI